MMERPACSHEAEAWPFALGALQGAARQAFEDHLPTCTECVRHFVALKRTLEVDDDAPRPSAALRARLRREVQAVVRPTPVRRWWERPVSVVVALAVMALALFSMQLVAEGKGRAPIDASRLALPPS